MLRLIGMMVVTITMVGCTTGGPDAARVQAVVAKPYVPIAFDGALENKVRAKFRGVLKDSASLLLANVKASRATLRSGAESIVVCGFYNSRNGFGAYAGYDGFATEVVNGETQAIFLDAPTLRQMCQIANAIPDAL